MHILDLDLDLFLNDVAYLQPDDREGLSSSEYTPWPENKVRRFLESRCGCSTSVPVAGRTVMYHDSAFDFWSELIDSGKLLVPFEVTHADAHSDLGMGNTQCEYLMSEFLHIEPRQRRSRLDRSRVDSGNYIAFAIACRWISKVTWVRHHNSRNDLPYQYIKQLKRNRGLIQLRTVDRYAFDNLKNKISFDYPSSLSYEPAVPLCIRSWRAFRSEKLFDYLVLSNSPNFTPPESDRLIPVIERYMNKI